MYVYVVLKRKRNVSFDSFRNRKIKSKTNYIKFVEIIVVINYSVCGLWNFSCCCSRIVLPLIYFGSITVILSYNYHIAIVDISRFLFIFQHQFHHKWKITKEQMAWYYLWGRSSFNELYAWWKCWMNKNMHRITTMKRKIQNKQRKTTSKRMKSCLSIWKVNDEWIRKL